MKNNIGSSIKSSLKQNAMIFALVIVMVLFLVLTEGVLLQPLNISNIIQQNAYVLVLAIGMLLCILISGNIDLSVGSVAGFVGAISAVFILKMHIPVLPAILMSLAVGVLIGMWHGFWIAYVGVPAFIATLAGLLIFRGLTMTVLAGTSLAPLPESYTFVAAGFVPDFVNIKGLNLLALLSGIIASLLFIFAEINKRRNRKRYNFAVNSLWAFWARIILIVLILNFFTFQLASYRGLPMVLVVVVILVLIYSFITNKTIPGRHIYAFGGNPKAAVLSGIKTKQILFWVYVNMGLLAALAGIIFTGRLNSATPKSGNGFELDAIASCFIGGASTTGGIGTVVGAIVGGLLMGVLNNGMSIMGVSIDLQQTIKGVVLIAAVGFDVWSKSRTKA